MLTKKLAKLWRKSWTRRFSIATVKLLANVLEVPPPYMYCEEQDIADLLLALHKIPSKVRKQKVGVLSTKAVLTVTPQCH